MKIFELTINDDDDLSGVEYLSLVKNPATEISWEVFNNDKPHTCSVEGYDFGSEELGFVDNLGTTPNGDYFLSGEFSNAELELTPQAFVSVPPITSNPNQQSFGDDPEGSVITRFFYAVDTTYGAPLIKTSRALCRKMILAQRIYSLSDLQNISQQLTSAGDTYKLVMRARINSQVDFYTYKAGKYCRHLWKRVDFPIATNESFESVLKKIPTKVQPALSKGTQVAMVGRPFVSEMSLFPPARGAGRNEFSKKDPNQPIAFHMGLFLYQSRFAAVLAEPTAKTITKVKLCYYGEPGDIYPIPEGECVEGWCAVDVYPEYFEGTGDVIEKFQVRHNFAQVPNYIQEAAQSAVNWAEENGWGSCGTDVGKQRAHDLARAGQEHSLETLTRMYSYGSRHKGDWDSSKSFEDGCGYLMMASWGFTPSNYNEAMAFLEREIKKGTEMNVAFSKDELKGDITAVVFQPNQKIYRYDAETNSPYFVFMSRDTIRKMLMKFSKNKQGKGGVVNLEHSGLIFSPDDVYTYENWLVGEDPEKDKSYELFGRTFEPGTWMTTIHFKDKRMFEEFVLSNKTSGISLEGAFQEIPFNFFKVENFVSPEPGEEENEFMNRCVSSDKMMTEYDSEQQRIAVCYSKWENKSFAFPDGTCWEGYEPYGTKIKDGREVPNCVRVKAEINTGGMVDYQKPNGKDMETKVEFAPYPWDDCIKDMTERYGETAAPKICGKIRSENMAQMGTYDGAPYYPYWQQAQEASVALGCSDYHFMEEYGYFPCKTHTEAKELYEEYNILQLLEMVLEDLNNE